MRMQSIIWELIMYLLWLNLLMIVAYGNRDPWSYTMNNSYKQMFVRGVYNPERMDKYTMMKVTHMII